MDFCVLNFSLITYFSRKYCSSRKYAFPFCNHFDFFDDSCWNAYSFCGFSECVPAVGVTLDTCRGPFLCHVPGTPVDLEVFRTIFRLLSLHDFSAPSLQLMTLLPFGPQSMQGCSEPVLGRNPFSDSQLCLAPLSLQ